MLYFIILTRVCNLRCLYCGNDPDPRIEPLEITYDIWDLKRFVEKDPEPIIAFYGGEPLLRINLLEEIMDNIKARHWVLQTNGIFLDRLEEKYLKSFDTILVSIDGRPEITNYYRGLGTYERVLENIKLIRERGFEGDLIARMTVSGKTDIFLDVKHLVELKDPNFDHVHWQLDVLWDSPPYQRYDDFDAWVSKSYNPGITRLVNYWYEKMVKEEKVLGIIPFIGIMKTLLRGERTNLRCGVGINAFTITTSGRIIACPIAPEFEWNFLGDIWNTEPEELPWRVTISGPCLSCDIYHICGGRCLFANKTMLWGIEGFRKVCQTVRHLVNELERIKPRVERLINAGVISEKDFDYPPFNNSVEIIP